MTPPNVLVYGDERCGFSEAAARAAGVDLRPLSLMPDALREEARARGHSTIPVCAVDGEFVGGWTELQCVLESGGLAGRARARGGGAQRTQTTKAGARPATKAQTTKARQAARCEKNIVSLQMIPKRLKNLASKHEVSLTTPSGRRRSITTISNLVDKARDSTRQRGGGETKEEETDTSKIHFMNSILKHTDCKEAYEALQGHEFVSGDVKLAAVWRPGVRATFGGVWQIQVFLEGKECFSLDLYDLMDAFPDVPEIDTEGLALDDSCVRYMANKNKRTLVVEWYEASHALFSHVMKETRLGALTEMMGDTIPKNAFENIVQSFLNLRFSHVTDTSRASGGAVTPTARRAGR